ncbi:MAG: DNA repair protein RecO [Clostridia bacterium]|nr:DNA repair protein RecO [Clostridia bacterium]
MATYKAEALVLDSRPFGEADRLVALLAMDGRRIRAVARGARRPESRLAAAVQPFVLGRYLLWRGRSLDGVSQAEIVEPFVRLRADGPRIAAASYVAELALAFAGDDESPGLGPLVCLAFRELASGDGELPAERRDRVLCATEAGLLSAAGYRPNLEACVVCGRAPAGEGRPAGGFLPSEGGVVCADCQARAGEGTVLALGGEALAVLRRLFAGEEAGASPFARLARLRISPRAQAEVEAALRAHLGYVLQATPKSAAFLDILSASGKARREGGDGLGRAREGRPRPPADGRELP